MNFCRDCRHIRKPQAKGAKEFEYASCAALSVEGVDLVSGARKSEDVMCSNARHVTGKCGPDAKLFVRKIGFAA